jgi:Mg-chelatase subunit ChlD
MNPDDAVTCSECMVLLDPSKLPKEEPEEKGEFAEKLKKTIDAGKLNEISATRKADIMFVFDCTGSMGGEIRAMQDAIIDFASAVKADGLDIQLGLIEFRDRTIGEEQKLHKFDGSVFTRKMSEFQKAVDKLKAEGGGPEPESSPDALMLAMDQEFRDTQNKTIVLITDAPPHIPDKSTKSYDEVIAKLKEKDINQFYVVTMLKKSSCHVHLKLLEGVQKYGGDGLAFELSKKDEDRKNHFKKVLMGLAKSISSKSV